MHKTSMKNNMIHSGDMHTVKLSGDGTKMWWKPNLINLTFTLLSEGNIAMSPNGNHTIAIINETENYHHFKTSLPDIIKEEEELTLITVNSTTFQVIFFLQWFKFLAIACGIEFATATYSCIWCKGPSI